MLYRSDRHWRTKRNFEVFRAHDFIAALVAQMPAKGVPSVRYYGWYSNKSRGLRRKLPAAIVPDTAPPLLLRRRRRVRWRELDPPSLGCRSPALPAVSGIPTAHRVDRDLVRHPHLPRTPRALRAGHRPASHRATGQQAAMMRSYLDRKGIRRGLPGRAPDRAQATRPHPEQGRPALSPPMDARPPRRAAIDGLETSRKLKAWFDENPIPGVRLIRSSVQNPISYQLGGSWSNQAAILFSTFPTKIFTIRGPSRFNPDHRATFLLMAIVIVVRPDNGRTTGPVNSR